MKHWMTLLGILAVAGFQPLMAQDKDFSSTRPGAEGGDVLTKPNPNAPLPKPKGTGAIFMMSEHGFQVINPGAPLSVGSGKQNVTRSIAHESNRVGDGNEEHKPYGGIVLVGLSF